MTLGMLNEYNCVGTDSDCSETDENNTKEQLTEKLKKVRLKFDAKCKTNNYYQNRLRNTEINYDLDTDLINKVKKTLSDEREMNAKLVTNIEQRNFNESADFKDRIDELSSGLDSQIEINQLTNQELTLQLERNEKLRSENRLLEVTCFYQLYLIFEVKVRFRGLLLYK